MYKKVEGHSHLVRDAKSEAIININNSEIDSARRAKISRKEKADNLNNMMEDLKSLKNEIAELKSMMLKKEE